MAARARVAIEKADGKVESILVFREGEPMDLGMNLHKFYSEQGQVEALVMLGDAFAVRGDLSQHIRSQGPCFFHDEAMNVVKSESLFVLMRDTVDSMDLDSGEFLYVFKGGEWEAYELIVDSFVPFEL